jgi:hypothetical protein
LKDNNILTIPENSNTVYQNIMHNDICFISNDYFKVNLPQFQCEYFAYNSTKYGLGIILTNYIEDIRSIKTTFDYNQYDGYIFNIDALNDISIINRYFIFPAYDLILSTLAEDINSSIDNFRQVYFTLFIVILLIILTVYLLIWMPFIAQLNLTVVIFNF